MAFAVGTVGVVGAAGVVGAIGFRRERGTAVVPIDGRVRCAGDMKGVPDARGGSVHDSLYITQTR